MIKFPYGLADFYALITEGYLYVDRTSHIRRVEEVGRALLFIRPRRFGKSLWLQTLRCYYDLSLAGEFRRLFGKLDAGRRPTALHNQYFVLLLNFSEVSARGSAEKIGRRLHEYVNNKIKDFLVTYAGALPHPVPIEDDATDTLRHLLTAIRETPHRLYLLIDEYDNFINEIMMTDAAAYRGLVQKGGPFKELFKSVKSSMEGLGLERVFITGVSPVAMSDLSSGFNVAEDIYLDAEFNALCGFEESEIRGVLAEIVDEDRAAAALATMRDWYDGYRFCEAAAELLYNPTNVLYFLKHLQRKGAEPEELYDRNLAMDQGKLAFLSRHPAGARVVSDLVHGGGTIEIARLETSFSMEDLVKKLDVNRRFIASFLYYLGLLTQTSDPRRRLRIPNLVVEKLYLDRMLELMLPAPEDHNLADETVLAFFHDGDLSPLLAFVEEKLLPALSNRDYRGSNEMVVKSLFLSLLFDDARYLATSELEVARGYADLCLLLRPHLRAHGPFFDLVFEFKYVSLQSLGRSGDALRRLDDGELRSLPRVRDALDAAGEQIGRYRSALEKRFGSALRLRCYRVVAVGLERLVGDVVAV